MTQHVAKVWLMKSRFEGYPQLSDFAIREEVLPPLKDGEYLVQAVWFSVDPYNRTVAARADFSEGMAMKGFQVARVLESRNEHFKPGDHVVGQWGWRTLTIANSSAAPPHGDEADFFAQTMPYKVDDYLNSYVKLSTTVGVTGMPGCTAYLGLLEACKPKPGDVVLVNSAAGAVGSAVGQIAKILGCKVIGYAGSDSKVAWLKEIGFDYAFNYKTCDLDRSISEAAPNGVDCFFDNAGGEFAFMVYQHMRKYGRVCQCGNTSAYNELEKPKISTPLSLILFRRLQIHGFIIMDYFPRWPEAINRLSKWIREGRLKYRESVYQGFEQMPQAFIDQMYGKNEGKTVVSA